MRPAEVVRRGAGYLERHDVDQPLATAEVLLASILGTDRTGLYLREEGLSTAEAKRFGRALCRRCSGIPAQHLTGEQGFRRLVLTARPGVFIPRPETETVVDAALAAIAILEAPVVVDVGTGTGAIALSIALEHPGARVFATDVSPEAVALAREHAVRFGLAVDVRQGDLLAPVADELAAAADLIVSNPPYVEPSGVDALPTDVRADPALALAGGLDVYARLFAQAADCLRPDGAVVVEIGDEQGEAVAAAMRAAGFVGVRVGPDLTGRDRFVEGRRT
jgi:release factor glutamine methyltransferase